MPDPVVSPAPRLAVFVDGENLSSGFADQVWSHARTLGTPILRRVYGNVTALNGWQSTPRFHIVHSGTGKNATDLLLCIEVLHVALHRQADAILIAASDRDCTHLATYLREASIPVFGIGEAKANEALRHSYCDFRVLGDVPAAASAPKPPTQASSPLPRVSLLDAVQRELTDPRGIPIQSLGTTMHRKGFKISNEPEKTWRKWLESRGNLFICDPKSPTARVRLRYPAAAPIPAA